MKYIRFIADVLPNLDAATCPVLPPSAGSGGGSAVHPFRVFILLPEAVEALVHPAQQVSEQFFILGVTWENSVSRKVIYLLAAVVGALRPSSVMVIRLRRVSWGSGPAVQNPPSPSA